MVYHGANATNSSLSDERVRDSDRQSIKGACRRMVNIIIALIKLSLEQSGKVSLMRELIMSKAILKNPL